MDTMPSNYEHLDTLAARLEQIRNNEIDRLLRNESEADMSLLEEVTLRYIERLLKETSPILCQMEKESPRT